MEIKNSPQTEADLYVSLLTELRPDWKATVTIEDYNLYKLGFIDDIPCTLHLDVSDEELSALEDELEEIKATVLPEMEKTRQNHSLDMIFFMLTNIITESSELICCGNESREKIIGAYDLEDNAQKLMLKGVVSRKKQLVPALVSALQQ